MHPFLNQTMYTARTFSVVCFYRFLFSFQFRQFGPYGYILFILYITFGSFFLANEEERRDDWSHCMYSPPARSALLFSFVSSLPSKLDKTCAINYNTSAIYSYCRVIVTCQVNLRGLHM